MSEIRGRILQYKADRRPVAFVAAMLAVHALVWWQASPLWAALLLLPLTAASTLVAPINHHHQHLNAFRSPVLNRVYDVVLALQTGIGPFGWVLHHNLGHHQNYLNQFPHDTPDESHWTRRDGSTMGRFEYSVHLFLHHPFDIFAVGRKHPDIFRNYWLMKLPVWGILGLLFYLNPINTLLVFLVPGLLTLFHTCWATYEHHAGHHAGSHYDASVNRENGLFNFMTCNLGYHTAHHKRPGLHWSLLPEYHRKIAHHIPERQILRTFW